MAKKHKLEFPQAAGRYWYLFWIGKIYIEDKVFKVNLFFVNKANPNVDITDFSIESQTFIHKVNASNLMYYYPGIIFDSQELNLIAPIMLDKDNPDYKKSLTRMRTRMENDKPYYPTSTTIPLVGVRNFPRVKELQEEDITFMKYYRSFTNRDQSKKIFTVIVTPYCLLDYFFFTNSRIINKILSGQAIMAFKFDKLIISSHPDKLGKKIAKLPYDNEILTKNEAKDIAPYLFMKDKLGVKMLNSIYSSLYNKFRKNKKNEDERTGAYMDLYFNTNKYELKLEGTSYYDKTIVKEKIKQHHNIYLASKITECIFLENNIFEVDEIVLIPLFPNNKNSDTDDVNITSLDTYEPSQEIMTLNMYPNRPASYSNNNKPDTIKTNQVRPFNIDVKIETLTGDNANIINTPSDISVDGVSTETGNDSIFDDLLLLQQDAEKIYYKTILIDNLEYFAEVVKELKEMEKSRNISVNDDPLNEGREKYPVDMKNINNYLIDIVEIQSGKKYIYAVEFGHGMIGIFNDTNGVQISSERLGVLLKQFIKKDEEQLKNKNSKKKENIMLWTIIMNNFDEEFAGQEIKIQRAVKHVRKDKSITDTAIKKTAEKILTRISV